MGEKWRRVDDEEDDDEVHLNIQEVWLRKMTHERWWSRGGIAVYGGATFQSPPPETEGGASLGSPTTTSYEEEGGRGVVSTTSPPPLPPLRRVVRGWRPSVQLIGSLQCGQRWREVGEGSGVEGSPPLHDPNKGGARASPLCSVNKAVDRSTGQLDQLTGD
ncbi:hypothetical protein Sjap_024131 [Stephania japonica]|uniref:Uncharacterized protein n=1 Tax=Stephania japonica TaxID=461633 RepID=A0AAP0ELI3_9MAGN